jgi:O-antigen/teichoic acid export membrane protein
MLRGTFWFGTKTVVQIVAAFWTIPLIVHAIGPDANGAYNFAWGFGFIQFLLEFGMGSAIQRQISQSWTRGDRAAVERIVGCGTVFYAGVAVIQIAVLAWIATYAVPRSSYTGASLDLAVRLLWLQAVMAPFFGLSTVATSVLQAARRYDFLPRLDLLVLLLRFGTLLVGLRLGVDFFLIVVVQVLMQVGLLLGPSLWVMIRELGIVPHFRGANWADFRQLTTVSAYLFLIQLSVVLADRIDTTILGFALPENVAGPATTVYGVVSKPFTQIRQTCWTLTYLVLPAVASLAAANDAATLERIKYDGTRLLIGLLAPVALLAAIDAGPFLTLWMGPAYTPYAGLMRLFLIATLPLGISVLVQTCIGLGKIKVIGVAALGGSLVNLPLSYFLTLRIGVAGVIWGTVLTTLFSNLLVPGIYAFRNLDVRPATFARRTLTAPLVGALALGLACLLLRQAGYGPDPAGPWAESLARGTTGRAAQFARAVPFLVDLTVGCLAYLAGYLAVPTGRGDAHALAAAVRRRLGG